MKLIEQNKMEVKRHRVAVYGVEQWGNGVLEDITTPQYIVHFVSKKSLERLSDYDSLILIQGAFEIIKRSTDVYGREHKCIACDRDELDRRIKEVINVKEGRGFVLMLLTQKFRDYCDGCKNHDTDIAKEVLNFAKIKRYDYEKPNPYVQSQENELIDFCNLFGRAYSFFTFFELKAEDYVPLVKDLEGRVVGFSMYRNFYFLPAISPKSEEIITFLKKLVNGVYSFNKKRVLSLPKWIDEYSLGDETTLKTEIEQYKERIEENKSRLDKLSEYKRILIESGNELVCSVSKVIEVLTGLICDCEDNKKEDLRLINEKGGIAALVEIKGVNGNIKISNVSQAFEHRERSPGYMNMPVILIANTFIGTARTVEEKDKAPDEEQIILAEKHNVLILRTLDLLRLLNKYFCGECSREDICNQLLTKVGWWEQK